MNKIVLTKEEMSHLRELGLDCSRASMCHYKVFFHYGEPYEDEDREFEEWKVDFMEEGFPANFYGIPDNDGLNYSIVKEVIPAFCLSDILEMIPVLYSTEKGLSTIAQGDGYNTYFPSIWKDIDDNYMAEYIDCDSSTWTFFEWHTSLDSAYRMLCWCIEHNYIKTN